MPDRTSAIGAGGGSRPPQHISQSDSTQSAEETRRQEEEESKIQLPSDHELRQLVRTAITDFFSTSNNLKAGEGLGPVSRTVQAVSERSPSQDSTDSVGTEALGQPRPRSSALVDLLASHAQVRPAIRTFFASLGVNIHEYDSIEEALADENFIAQIQAISDLEERLDLLLLIPKTEAKEIEVNTDTIPRPTPFREMEPPQLKLQIQAFWSGRNRVKEDSSLRAKVESLDNKLEAMSHDNHAKLQQARNRLADKLDEHAERILDLELEEDILKDTIMQGILDDLEEAERLLADILSKAEAGKGLGVLVKDSIPTFSVDGNVDIAIDYYLVTGLPGAINA